jgi:hypothetical protein
MTTVTRDPIAVARCLRAGALALAALLPLAGCAGKGSDAPGENRSAGQSPQRDERPPIDPDVVREDVESDEEWRKLRQAGCPREVDDRREEMDRYPAIHVMQSLGYVTVTDGVSYNRYVKKMELTPEAYQQLGEDLREDGDYYVVDLAEREYMPGREEYEPLPKDPNRLTVEFKWKWKPLNPLGDIMGLWREGVDTNEYYGRARYVKVGDGWKLESITLEPTQNYRFRV